MSNIIIYGSIGEIAIEYPCNAYICFTWNK